MLLGSSDQRPNLALPRSLGDSFVVRPAKIMPVVTTERVVGDQWGTAYLSHPSANSRLPREQHSTCAPIDTSRCVQASTTFPPKRETNSNWLLSTRY